MIYYNLKRGITYHESHKNLCEALGSIAPGKSTVRKWFPEFGFGRSHFIDDTCCGQPVFAATQENAARVKELIREDAQITCKDLHDILGIGMSALNEILHHQLGIHKQCARWVPHQLTEEQKVGRVQWCFTIFEKYDSGRTNSAWNIVNGDETWMHQFDPEMKAQSSVWLFPGDTPPLKFKQSRSTSEQIVALHIAKNRTHHNHSTGGKAHCDHRLVCVLMPPPSAACCTYPMSKVQYHPSSWQCPCPHCCIHQGAPSQQGCPADVSPPPPPYSRDLAPCDFFLFPHVNKQLRGTRYDSPQDAVWAFTRTTDSIDKVTWSEVWKSWFQRMAVASKLMEGTLKSGHERKASKWNCFFVATNFQIDPCILKSACESPSYSPVHYFT